MGIEVCGSDEIFNSLLSCHNLSSLSLSLFLFLCSFSTSLSKTVPCDLLRQPCQYTLSCPKIEFKKLNILSCTVR